MKALPFFIMENDPNEVVLKQDVEFCRQCLRLKNVNFEQLEYEGNAVKYLRLFPFIPEFGDSPVGCDFCDTPRLSEHVGVNQYGEVIYHICGKCAIKASQTLKREARVRSAESMKVVLGL